MDESRLDMELVSAGAVVVETGAVSVDVVAMAVVLLVMEETEVAMGVVAGVAARQKQSARCHRLHAICVDKAAHSSKQKETRNCTCSLG